MNFNIGELLPTSSVNNKLSYLRLKRSILLATQTMDQGPAHCLLSLEFLSRGSASKFGH